MPGKYIVGLRVTRGEMSGYKEAEITFMPMPTIQAVMNTIVKVGERVSVAIVAAIPPILQSSSHVFNYLWEISGPGNAEVGNHEAESTHVTFDQEGVYMVRALMKNGLAESSDVVQVTVTRGAAGSGGGNNKYHFNPTKETLPIEIIVTEASSHVRVTIYDIKGRRIKDLYDQSLPAGSHSITWDGRNNEGSIVATGVYHMHMDIGGEQTNRKIAVHK